MGPGLRQLVPKPSTASSEHNESKADRKGQIPSSRGRGKTKIKAIIPTVSSEHESISAELKSENQRLLTRIHELEERLMQSEDRNAKAEHVNSLTRTGDTINSFSNIYLPDSIQTTQYTNNVYQGHQLHNFSLPLYLAQPISTPSVEPLGQAYSAFLSHAKYEIVNGKTPDDIIGQPDVDISASLGYTDPEETSPLSKWAYDMSKAFNIKDQHTQLGIMHCFFKFMRWQIHPTPETYADIPALLRPTSTQLFVPHPIWVDYLLWPPMRELLIAKPELYIGALDWLTPCETVHVRGSFRPRDIYDIDPKQNYINVKKSFKDYVAKASNWPVGQALIDMLPELAGNMVVEEGGVAGSEGDGEGWEAWVTGMEEG